MVETSVFAGLNFTLHRFDQFDNVYKSRVEAWWRWRWQLEENNKSASSANNETDY